VLEEALKRRCVKLHYKEHQGQEGFIFGKMRASAVPLAKDRAIAVDNDPAEQDLRPSVIARKVSIGMIKEAGAKVRNALIRIKEAHRALSPQSESRPLCGLVFTHRFPPI
jgi:hypothetical protein